MGLGMRNIRWCMNCVNLSFAKSKALSSHRRLCIEFLRIYDAINCTFN